ncbi:MAG TPA: SDR family NAD(P)-dependent oxidoreductase, partial [Longimicrobiales bacterium]|nr:SDR family NAD(P)-dependent oxidoreductase [Longimicrobiales bacterium]
MLHDPPELRDPRVERTRPNGSEVLPSPRPVDQAVEALLDEVSAETQPKPLLDAGSLRGQVAIVTGGSSGIGRAVALELARCGVHIAYCFLDDGAQSRIAAQEVARELRQAEVRTYFRSCDVRDSQDVKAFVAEVHAELGPVQILVNNAGI